MSIPLLLFMSALAAASRAIAASPASAPTPRLPQLSGGLKGYISMNVSQPPAEYRYGVSFYSAIWPLLKSPLESFQIGLPSTWIIPDNNDFNQPLCPPGTIARDNWPERGPYYRDVFQTIEGGLGFWASTRFGSATPKYRMNGTPDGYNHEISSPGWGFGNPQPLPDDIMGIAQLSNRLLIPPDGFTFRKGSNGQLLGNAWMALPLMEDIPSPKNQPTGDQCWTLFLNTSNFKGPAAFWIPETWSKLSKSYPTIDGRGLDARPALMDGGAMEFNTVPYFESRDGQGVLYSKIPELQFPVNPQGQTILMQDIRMYSADALFEPVRSWLYGKPAASGKFNLHHSWSPTLSCAPIQFHQGSGNLSLTGIEKTVQTKIYHSLGSRAFGLQWVHTSIEGVFPEYYKQVGDKMVAVSKSEVPETTNLLAQTFEPAAPGTTYASPASPESCWKNPGPKAGPFYARLSDGSVVTYYWYRFVDQPSLQQLHLGGKEKEQLQSRIEHIHSTWKINGFYMPSPGSGKLVPIDQALIVKPPRGLNVGYVPIVTRQEKR